MGTHFSVLLQSSRNRRSQVNERITEVTSHSVVSGCTLASRGSQDVFKRQSRCLDWSLQSFDSINSEGMINSFYTTHFLAITLLRETVIIANARSVCNRIYDSISK